MIIVIIRLHDIVYESIRRLQNFSSTTEYDGFIKQPSNKEETTKRLLSVLASSSQSGAKTNERKRLLITFLSDQMSLFSDPKPACIPLNGSYPLIYGDSKNPSTGNIGPFMLNVVQTFGDSKTYVNNIFISFFKIEAHAEKQVLDDFTILVTYKEIILKLFDIIIFRRRVDYEGKWKQVFVGVVNEGNSKKILRIMKTPDLFILEQPI